MLPAVGRASLLEWSYDPDPADTAFTTDFSILLREGNDEVRVRYGRHVLGLFADAQWLAIITSTGLVPTGMPGPDARHVFVATKPR